MMTVHKPNFFIVGFPKCGTTSLAAWLDGHPEVCMSRPKEPHYFVPKLFQRTKSLDEYLEHFSHAEPHHQVIGEASTLTSYFPAAIESILEYQPEAKFICCIRNPVEMIVSLHNMFCYSSVHSIYDLAQAWESRKKITTYPHGEHPIEVRELYRWAGALGTHFDALQKAVPAERLHPIILDDLIRDEARVLRGVTDFLGIAPSSSPYPRANEKKKPKFRSVSRVGRWLSDAKRRLGIRQSLRIGVWVQSLNTVPGEGVVVLTPKDHAMLDAHFEPEIRKLEAAFARDLSHWLARSAERVSD